MTSQRKKTHRIFHGIVVSDRMQKTIVVRVSRVRWHSKYQRQYRTTKKFKVHDEKNAYHIGDVVTFMETKPLSKEKRWTVIGKATA